MNREIFIKEVNNLGIELNDSMLNKLEEYMNFLIEYNAHTNLTAITKEEDIYLKHFYDSLTIIKVIDLNNYTNLIDIGTGAGFPGMVLKIVYPHLNVTLLDSNNKKTTFLKELSKRLSIDVEIVNERVEDYSKRNLNGFDIVTSRAVANLRVLAELSIPLVKKDSYFIPLKGMLDNSYEDSLETLEILGTRIEKVETFDLFNESGIRNILLIKKNRLTNIEEVRTYDKIIKKPLKKRNK